jgi:replication factor A1
MQQYDNLAPHVQEITRALNNRVEPAAIEDELRRYLEFGVPLAQAKRDIVRMHGGSLQAGAKKVADLVPEERGLELTVKVLTVNPKDITVKGEPKRIFYGFLADETGKVSYTSWKDQPNLIRGNVVHVKNAYAKKGFREGVDLNLGDYTTVEPSDAELDVKDDFAPGATPSGEPGAFAGGRMSVEKKVRDLRDGMGSVTLTGRILDIREKVVSTANGQRTLVEGELADETGRVAFACWEPSMIPAEAKQDGVIRIKNGYVRAFRGVPNFNFGNNSTVEEKPFNLGELEAAGGAQGVAVEGVVLEVKKGSGLIFRCPAESCNRVLQKMECRVHGKQKGNADLRVKAVLDDGLGAATFFANREATEKILGKTLAQCQELAREAMTVDVVQDEITEKLTGRRVVVKGNASSDEYGLQILSHNVDFVPPRDVTQEAERLLGQVVEILSEVSE